jgi:hypothetical protein
MERTPIEGILEQGAKKNIYTRWNKLQQSGGQAS